MLGEGQSIVVDFPPWTLSGGSGSVGRMICCRACNESLGFKLPVSMAMNCSRPDPAFVRQARNADGVGCRKWNVTTHPLHGRQSEGLNGMNALALLGLPDSAEHAKRVPTALSLGGGSNGLQAQETVGSGL